LQVGGEQRLHLVARQRILVFRRLGFLDELLVIDAERRERVLGARPLEVEADADRRLALAVAVGVLRERFVGDDVVLQLDVRRCDGGDAIGHIAGAEERPLFQRLKRAELGGRRCWRV